MIFENTIAFAKSLDGKDILKSFRDKFYIPQINGKDCMYFTGNSLGLQPKSTQDYVLSVMEDWANYGVEGHFYSPNPWVKYHELFPPLLSKIIGAKETELVVMNSLTVNLHALMASFYQPTKQRYKIICEAKAFPSDQYAFASQAALHGFDAADVIIEVTPREGKAYIELEDILASIKKHGEETAVVIFGGINYYSGQVFDMEKICKAAHEVSAYCGFDLAHAAGNVPIQMHNWDVDFACWCSYKYLNSGPGGVAGAFIHEKHFESDLPRLAGWWGHDKANRFKMESEFVPIPTAEGWQLSNGPMLSMAAHKASLDLFNEASMDNIFEKAKTLSAYAFYIVDEVNKSFGESFIEIITPREEKEHGCQLSLLFKKDGKRVFDALKKHAVLADWREPNVIRIAPVALYNSFEDVFRFGEILKHVLE